MTPGFTETNLRDVLNIDTKATGDRGKCVLARGSKFSNLTNVLLGKLGVPVSLTAGNGNGIVFPALRSFATGRAIRGNREGVAYRPATLKAPFDNLSRNARFSRPFWHGQAATINLNRVVVAFIVGLLGGSLPATVVRAITEIVVDSAHGILGAWARPHILKESLKRMPPAGTDCYPSCAIVFIGSDVRIGAASNHTAPSCICFRPRHPVGALHVLSFLKGSA